MLTRAARRRDCLRHLQHVADQIQLPWLCPTLRQPYINAHRRSIASRPSLSRLKAVATLVPPSRQLASAAPLPEPYERNDDYTSSLFYPEYQTPISQRRRPEISALRPWDLTSIIRIDNTTAQAPEQVNTNQVLGIDIRGNVTEVECNLEACLQLKKWQRACASLGQLKLLYHTDLERLRFQYNKVLAYMVEDLMEVGHSENEERITQWIEREMKHVDLEPDAHTIALVLKGVLTSLVGSKRDRTVRRYWDMAKRFDLQAEVGSLRDILSERDLGLISEICPLDAEGWRDLDTEIHSSSDPDIVLSEDMVSSRPDIYIREMDQKGMGLTALRQSLSLFSDPQTFNLSLEEHLDLTAEEHATLRQHRLERDATEAAVNRWKIEHEKMAKMGLTGDLAHGKMGALLWQWHEIMTQKIYAELKKVREAESKNKKTAQDRLRVEYGPFLEQLKPEKVAAVTAIALLQIMNKTGASKPIKLVRLVTELGRTIEAEHQAETLWRENWKHYKETLKHNREMRESAAQSNNSALNGEDEPNIPKKLHHRSPHPGSRMFLKVSEWTIGIHAKLGAILCELMFDTAKIIVKKQDKATGKTMTLAQPIFIRQTVYLNGKKVGMVSLHDSFVEVMASQPPGFMIAKQLPMVSKPRPWTGFRKGGFLQDNVPVLRVKYGEGLQRDYANAAADRGDLDQLFAGLDILGQTGWNINKDVFRVMVEAWNTGEAIANLPPLNKQFETPKRPAVDAPRGEMSQWYGRMRSIEHERSGIHSNRCFQNFQMEVAKAYLDETFYLPHNLDFRGRAYPIPPYLNQMGADNCRGLLYFAKGRALGEDGLRWLKVHLSNVFGYDKASLTDRAQFPMDHLDDVRDSVENPLNGRRWWLSAEDPWQCLATCNELIHALDSPDPTKFVSHLPVHQDGSCNGLQHYAALGGDIAGARQVNLEPGDKPADVYTGVAELVKAEVAQDAANGDALAQLLDGRITRKIVKQTVMTNVYGVTFLGAIRQVRKQIDVILPDVAQMQKAGVAATYIARKIFTALGSLFTGAHNIQYWLGDCANRISGSLSPAQLEQIAEKEWGRKEERVRRPGRRQDRKQLKRDDVFESAAFRTSVIWTTPLKLPVVQPYRVNKGQQIKTNLQNISLVEPSVTDAVDKRKQLQAFPPNFIHSLDATHMILSALKAYEMGLTFAAVHDSFWCHAADVNSLNMLLRDAFIRMHTEDIVGRLAAEFRTRYMGHLYMATVQKNSPLGRAIAEYRANLVSEGNVPEGKGTKPIQARKYVELLREIKKRKLMDSNDPKERGEGEQMVTAATLFEKFDGEQYIKSKDSLGETAIGNIPNTASDEVIAQAMNAEGVAGEVDLEGTLEPLMDPTSNDDFADAGAQGESDDALGDEEDVDSLSDKVEKPRKKAASTTAKDHLWLWLPLTFRKVPKKGEFDVNRLRDSQYFFS